MDESVSDKRIGVVIYLRVNEGSKSECVVPFLYQGRDAEPLQIMLKDDNPFENGGFTEYDGQKVAITGNLSQGGVFIVDSVVRPEISN